MTDETTAKVKSAIEGFIGQRFLIITKFRFFFFFNFISSRKKGKKQNENEKLALSFGCFLATQISHNLIK